VTTGIGRRSRTVVAWPSPHLRGSIIQLVTRFDDDRAASLDEEVGAGSAVGLVRGTDDRDRSGVSDGAPNASVVLVLEPMSSCLCAHFAPVRANTWASPWSPWLSAPATARLPDTPTDQPSPSPCLPSEAMSFACRFHAAPLRAKRCADPLPLPLPLPLLGIGAPTTNVLPLSATDCPKRSP
jgi:hypothetical protein